MICFANHGSGKRFGMLTAIVVLLLSMFPSTHAAISSSCNGPKSPGELRDQLWAGSNSTYDKLTRPGFAKWVSITTTDADSSAMAKQLQPPPDTVELQLHLIAIKELNQKRGEFQLIAWLRQRWVDERLSYSTTTKKGTTDDNNDGCFPNKVRQGFPSNQLDEIWTPDIVIENEVDSSKVAESFWIYPDGRVVTAQHVKLTLSCDMDLSDFPNDKQNCFVRIGTWLEDANDVILDYYKDMDAVTQTSTKDETGGAYEYTMKKLPQTHLGSESTTQEESTLEFNFQFTRFARHYYDFVMLPAIFFVTIGWLSFFVSRGAAPARVTMSMICFLTNVNFLSNQLRMLPQQGNNIYLLEFLTISTIFTFYTILEYVCCNVLLRIENRVQAAHNKAAIMKMKKLDEEVGNNNDNNNGSLKKQRSISMSKPRFETNYNDLIAVGFDYKLDRLLLSKKGHLLFRDQHLDILSRYIYPIAYIACVLGLTFSE